MLGTSTTPYDLRFQLLGIPVRVHPMFWLVSAMLGWQDRNLPMVLTWVSCVFVSILVHEFGHGLIAKYFHGSPSIVLYGMGGLCYSKVERAQGQRLAVIFGGPGAGFILFGLVLLGTTLSLGITAGEHLALILSLLGLDPNQSYFTAVDKFPSETVFAIYRFLVWINLMWGLVNLLPIWPLDGGQAGQILLSMVDRRQGIRRGHIVSLLTAGLIVALIATRGSDLFLAFFFGFFAFLNFQELQSMHEARSLGRSEGNDWWHR
jgi:stage IV sporulation protein FB